MDSLSFPTILKNIASGTDSEESELDIVKRIFTLFSTLEHEIVETRTNLIKKLKVSNDEFDNLIANIFNKNFFQSSEISDEELFSLSHSGKRYYKNEICSFLRNNNWGEHFDDEEILHFLDTQKCENQFQENTPSFIGCLVADKQGKTLLRFEIFDGAIQYYLNSNNIDDCEEINPDLDLELIPMFVSALEKFSKNINLKDLSGLKLKGTGVKLQIFPYDKFTITCFINPIIDLKNVKTKFRQYFDSMFENYQQELKLSMETGYMENISHLSDLGREMLKELNKFVYIIEFKNLVKNLKEFDMTYAKTLYSKLNKLYNDLNLKFGITLEKIINLRSYLVRAMFDEDLAELKKIVKHAQDVFVENT